MLVNLQWIAYLRLFLLYMAGSDIWSCGWRRIRREDLNEFLTEGKSLNFFSKSFAHGTSTWFFCYRMLWSSDWAWSRTIANNLSDTGSLWWLNIWPLRRMNFEELYQVKWIIDVYSPFLDRWTVTCLNIQRKIPILFLFFNHYLLLMSYLSQCMIPYF